MEEREREKEKGEEGRDMEKGGEETLGLQLKTWKKVREREWETRDRVSQVKKRERNVSGGNPPMGQMKEGGGGGDGHSREEK